MSWLFNPLSANSTKWPNTLKQFVGSLLTKCLSVFDQFVKLALKWLSSEEVSIVKYNSLNKSYRIMNLKVSKFSGSEKKTISIYSFSYFWEYQPQFALVCSYFLIIFILVALVRFRKQSFADALFPENFANFTGKHLCWSLFLIKSFKLATILKKDSNTSAFLWNLRNF